MKPEPSSPEVESYFADTIENVLVQLGKLGDDALVYELDDELGCTFGNLVCEINRGAAFGV